MLTRGYAPGRRQNRRGRPRYQWINSIQAAGKGILSADLRTVQYEIFELT